MEGVFVYILHLSLLLFHVFFVDSQLTADHATYDSIYRSITLLYDVKCSYAESLSTPRTGGCSVREFKASVDFQSKIDEKRITVRR